MFPLHLCRFLDEDAALLPLLALPCLHTTDQVQHTTFEHSRETSRLTHTTPSLPPSLHLCLSFFSPSSYPLCLQPSALRVLSRLLDANPANCRLLFDRHAGYLLLRLACAAPDAVQVSLSPPHGSNSGTHHGL